MEIHIHVYQSRILGFNLFFLKIGYLFSHSCHWRYSVCRDRYQNFSDSFRSQWKYRGNASPQKWGQVRAPTTPLFGEKCGN